MHERRRPHGIAVLAVSLSVACGDSEVADPERGAPPVDAGDASISADRGDASSDVDDAGSRDGGRLVDATTGDRCDRCRGVLCPAPEARCEGDVAYIYGGDGFCNPVTGQCDYSEVEVTFTCERSMCGTGGCVDTRGSGTVFSNCEEEALYRGEIGDLPPGCRSPWKCDGEIAVRSLGFTAGWSCDYVSGALECVFDEETEDCSQVPGTHCRYGRCVECDSSHACDAGERCSREGRCTEAFCGPGGIWKETSVGIDYELELLGGFVCRASIERDELTDDEIADLAALELVRGELRAGCDTFQYFITVRDADGSTADYIAWHPDCADKLMLLLDEFDAWAKGQSCSTEHR